MTSHNNPGHGSMTLSPSMLWAECQLNCSVDDCDRDCLESRVWSQCTLTQAVKTVGGTYW